MQAKRALAFRVAKRAPLIVSEGVGGPIFEKKPYVYGVAEVDVSITVNLCATSAPLLCEYPHSLLNN